jgi:RNA polymerase sigma-70 factor (ECF subfamily)
MTYAMKLTKEEDNAKDLLQETLQRAYLQRHRFAVNLNFRGWLRVIMKNLYLNEYNKQKRLPQRLTTDSADYYIDQAKTVYNEGPQNLTTLELHDSINRLDGKLRDVILMYHMGFKYDEIAERMDIPLGTVKNRIHVARERLKKKLSRRYAIPC